MRRLFLVSSLFLAGCATTPQPSVQPQPQEPAPVQPQQQRGDLLGLTAAELFQRFGRPALQVREGPGLKLQFRGSCVLDAYLYPPTSGQGPDRVTHVDTRLPSGVDTNQQSCIAALQGA